MITYYLQHKRQPVVHLSEEEVDTISAALETQLDQWEELLDDHLQDHEYDQAINAINQIRHHHNLLKELKEWAQEAGQWMAQQLSS